MARVPTSTFQLASCVALQRAQHLRVHASRTWASVDDILASEPPSADDRESHKAEVRKQFMTKLWYEWVAHERSRKVRAHHNPGQARNPPRSKQTS